MKKLNDMMIKLHVKAYSMLDEFKNSERGDTNFVSMLLIIGIVVVLAGAFLTLGNTVMSSVSEKVTNFIDGL